MHHQIRIPPDRRSKMRITLRGKSKVPAILLAIASLLQRPQHEIAKDALFRLTLDLRNQLLIITRRDVDTARQNDVAPRTAPIAPPPVRNSEALHRNRADPERVAKVSRD